MYNVSQNFIDQMRETVRHIYGKVQVDYTDPFLDQSITVSANEEARISHKEQVADALTEPTKKYASLDGSWVLDGTYSLAPTNALDGEMGWWGAKLADASGLFTVPYPMLTVTFTARPIDSLKVVADSQRAEYPVNFIIKLYNASDTLLYTHTVIDNNSVEWKTPITPVTQVSKMTLEISKWSHPGRQVKIVEFFTSIQEIYVDDNIFEIGLLEEREVSQGSLPVGNISSNEIKISLDNSDRHFDVGNTMSSLYGLLKPNRRIKAWLGVKNNDLIEWAPMGVFWSSDWSAPEDSVEVSTTGRDRLELLTKSDYSTSQVQVNKTLYQLAEAVLQDAGLNVSEYWIDAELQNYVVPYSYFESDSHRETLRVIAEAALGQVYCDREGIIRVEGFNYTQSRIEEVTQTVFLEGSFPAEIEGIEAYGISADDYFSKDNPTKTDEIANYIEVETQPLRTDTAKEQYRSNEAIIMTAGRVYSLTAYFNDTPCINATASLEGATNTTITSTTYYAWGANIKLTNSGAITENVILVINATPLKILNKDKAIAQDATSILDNGKIKFTFPANPLIQTIDRAQQIADGLLASYKNPRRDLSLDWRGNPALLLGDIITTPDYQKGNLDKRGYYYITKQDIQYNGALSAKLEGRRAL